MKPYTFVLYHKINILSLRLISQRPPRGVHRNWARFRSNKKIFLQNLKCSISMESTSQMEQKILKHHVKSVGKNCTFLIKSNKFWWNLTIKLVHFIVEKCFVFWKPILWANIVSCLSGVIYFTERDTPGKSKSKYLLLSDVFKLFSVK